MTAKGVSQLHTEQRNPNTIGIDRMSTAEILQKINDEDRTVAEKVREALPQVEKAVDLLVERMRTGGRMVYVGAGTSGRLGFMDAAECPPTYGVSDRVACIMAGGQDAVFAAKESVEDDAVRAGQDLADWGLTEKDTVVAAAASGRTPYCIGALDYARSIGAGAICIVCNPNSEMAPHAQVAIEVDTGCEVIMGSTRMKAGTAQKMIMNMLSTTVMIRLGRTCDNLMVCLHAKNEKLINRVVRLYLEATGETDSARAEEALRAAHGRLDVAVLMQKTGADYEKAAQAMDERGDFGWALLKLSGTAG